jgi:hypothetical protein
MKTFHQFEIYERLKRLELKGSPREINGGQCDMVNYNEVLMMQDSTQSTVIDTLNDMGSSSLEYFQPFAGRNVKELYKNLFENDLNQVKTRTLN